MGSEAYPNTAMTFEQLKRRDEAWQTSATGALDQRPGSQSGLAAAVAAAVGAVVEPAGQIAASGAIDWQTIHVLVFTGAELGSLERNYGFSPYATTRVGGQCLLVPPHKLECCLISKRGAEKHAQRRRRCSVVSPSSRLWPVLSLRCSSVVVLFTAAQHYEIPPGHLPPPGECRIWYPDRPAGQQPPPGSCGGRVPPGAVMIRG